MEPNSFTPNPRYAKREGKTGLLLVLAPILLVLLVQVILLVFVYQLAVVRGIAAFSGESYADLLTQLTDMFLDPSLQVIVLFLYSITCIVWFGVWFAKEFMPKDETGKRIWWPELYRGRTARIAAGAVVFAIGGQYAANYLMSALAMLRPQWLSIYEQMIENIGLNGEELPLSLILYTVLFGPICEELTFRGLTFGYARRMTSFLWANIVQALLFGMLHGNMLQGTMAFCLGLVLGYIYEETQSITVVCLLHILFNTAGVFGTALVYQASGPVLFFLCFLGGMIATYVGTLLLVPRKEQA